MQTTSTIVPLHTTPGVSRYASLAAALRARVVSGEWPPGTAPVSYTHLTLPTKA